MKKFWIAILAVFATFATLSAEVADIAAQLAAKCAPGTITYKDNNNYLYSKNELLHLAKGALANGEIVKKSACAKPANADPIPALKFFNDELAKRGIKLIVVPVPPKVAIEPCSALKRGEAMSYLKPFYQELRSQGIDVLDLSEIFLAESNKHFYCRTDAHWNPTGIGLAAEDLAKRIDLRGTENFTATSSSPSISGDLAKSLAPDAPERENIDFVSVVGKAIDESSPILLIGDSHTLVFSTGGDMLEENGGLAERLAVQLKMPIDRIGVKGSAATAVRINLYRKAVRAPQWLKNKKFVIYCFSCREFTESNSGWVKVPVAK